MLKKIQAVLALVVVSCMPMQVCASRNVKRCAQQARMQQQKWQEKVSERSQLMPKPCEASVYAHSEKTITSPLGLVFMTTLALSVLSRCESCAQEKPEALSNMHWDKMVNVFLPGGFAQGVESKSNDRILKNCKHGLKAFNPCFNNCSACKKIDIDYLKEYKLSTDNFGDDFRFEPVDQLNDKPFIVVGNDVIYFGLCLKELREQCQSELSQLYAQCSNYEGCVISKSQEVVLYATGGLITLYMGYGLCKKVVDGCKKIVRFCQAKKNDNSNSSRAVTPMSSPFPSRAQTPTPNNS